MKFRSDYTWLFTNDKLGCTVCYSVQSLGPNQSSSGMWQDTDTTCKVYSTIDHFLTMLVWFSSRKWCVSGSYAPQQCHSYWYCDTHGTRNKKLFPSVIAAKHQFLYLSMTAPAWVRSHVWSSIVLRVLKQKSVLSAEKWPSLRCETGGIQFSNCAGSLDKLPSFVLLSGSNKYKPWVSEQLLNGTSAHIRLFSAIHWHSTIHGIVD